VVSELRSDVRSLGPLLDAVDALASDDLSGLDGERLGDRLIAVRRAADLLDLEFARVAAAFAATDEYDIAGYNTPLHWMRENCKISGRQAGDAVAVGEREARLQRSIAAAREGSIGFAHVALIARTAEALDESGRAEAFDESPLLKNAARRTVAEFRRECYHHRHALDPQGALAEHVDLVERRSLEVLPRADGAVSLHGFLDTELGTALRTALDPLARRAGRDDARPRWRRYGDALLELCLMTFDGSALPTKGCERPHVQVTATLETLLGTSNATGHGQSSGVRGLTPSAWFTRRSQ